ncbi:alpha/beta hydrolase family protein [Aureliella helgolandensis]|uniref:Acetylxylan esterase n=1 Tax=Aureliella helgolandensis TaxID=2527968 RepID=A0A518G2D6_9BACT|nr:alpha/beta hydrolase [Aureliella helgolandensis]QDV22709.1 Acetylxylan esterase precursor [Aureliella helgolandensis]
MPKLALRQLPLLLTAILPLFCEGRTLAENPKITPDVVYGHKLGLAMTCDVFAPTQNSNGAAVLYMVSGGWYSNWTPPEQMQVRLRPLTDQGFTVFAVRHGSSPRFSIAEAVSDVRRSVRYIRLHAEEFSIAPNRIGVFGLSAGGHLSLMLGTASDEGQPSAADPVERVSDRVQAVVAYVAPTDLRAMGTDAPNRLPAYEKFPALQLPMQDLEPDSPLLHVSHDDPPTLLLAGTKDALVPVEHSRNIQAAFEKAEVKSQLIEFPEAGHGFEGEDAQKSTQAMVDWFTTHLVKQSE